MPAARGSRGGRANASCATLFILLFHSIARYALLERKPPLTAALIFANVVFYLRPGRLSDILPTFSDACLNPELVFKDWNVKRIFLSAFYHVDDTHLLYNMLSLLWKGVQLEMMMGTLKFAETVTFLLILSHTLVILLSQGLALLISYKDAPYLQCRIGFSAILFGMKTILNWNSPTYTDIFGILVPTRHVAWFELVLAHMLVPGASFLGHFCGILAGLIYVHYGQWLCR